MKRLISWIISIGIIVTGVLPNMTYAKAEAESIGEAYREEQTEAEGEEAYILSELEEKRESNVKHYAMSDGTIAAAVYKEAVHYEENGKWEDIDNTLSEGNGEYTNGSSDIKVRFSKKSNSNYIYIKRSCADISFSVGL